MGQGKSIFIKNAMKRILFLYVFSLLSYPSYTQQLIEGVVIDSEGSELIGADVIVVNGEIPQKGTSTGWDGEFALTLDPSDSVLVSYYGLKDQMLSYQDLVADNLITLAPKKYIGCEINAGYGIDVLSLDPTPCYCDKIITLELPIVPVSKESIAWDIYPNPTADFITINSISLDFFSPIQILNQDGAIIDQVLVDQLPFQYDLSPLPIGIYQIGYQNKEGFDLIGSVSKIH